MVVAIVFKGNSQRMTDNLLLEARMRNKRTTITGAIFSTLLAVSIGGCTTPNESNSTGKSAGTTSATVTPQTGALRRADAALKVGDFPKVITAADEQLKASNTSKSKAQALYYKGRAIEGRSKSSPATTVSDLSQARSLYEQALATGTNEPDASVIRASLANVAYFQEDFTTARGHWLAAQKNLPDKDSRAWALYRVGLCEQRLGRFGEADKTFGQVQRSYPDSEQARRAREHQGTTSFRVQVATFSRSDTADKLVEQLKTKGLRGLKQSDPAGRLVVLLTGYPTYQAAKAAREQIAGDFPDAMVLP